MHYKEFKKDSQIVIKGYDFVKMEDANGRRIKVVVYDQFRKRPATSNRFCSEIKFQYMNETKKSTGKADNIQHLIDRLKILDNQRWLVTQWEKKASKAWPSMHEIREGVIFESNKINPDHEKIWQRLFECPGDQIQWHNLENPSYDLVAQMMYIYSLETFLPEAI